MKQSKCKHCKQPFIKQGLSHVACSYDCVISLLKKETTKKEKAKTKEQKEKLKTYTQKVNDVKKVFQTWIRERDKDLPCISCGATFSIPYWTAGHYKDANSYRGVIFNEDNVWKCCVKCNYFKSGNLIEYRQRLIKKIGIKRVKALEELAEQTKKHKYSDAELLQIKNKYNGKSRN